jgi:hypothetical protein
MGRFHSIHFTTAPSEPRSPSQDASILLCLLFVFHLGFLRICDVSLRKTSSHLVLGFQLREQGY